MEGTNLRRRASCPVKKTPTQEGRRQGGAGDGIRTRDIQHGKLMLYQLSYSRRGAGCNQWPNAVKQPP